MELTAKEKGFNLEEAVSIIEEMILSSDPSHAKSPFKITTHKSVSVKGVNHEIDVYVEIDNGGGYQSIFIFECKNWKKPVNKNEIIVFEKKINDANAQKGFFVAKKFTRYAKAMAAQSERIVLYTVTEENSLLAELAEVPFIEPKIASISILTLKKDRDKSNPIYVSTNIESCRTELEGRVIDFKKYIDDIATQIILKRSLHDPMPGSTIGTTEFEYKDSLYFNDTLFIDDMNIERIDLTISGHLIISKLRIKYSFEIKTRGKIASCEHEMSAGHILNVSLLTRSGPQ